MVSKVVWIIKFAVYDLGIFQTPLVNNETNMGAVHKYLNYIGRPKFPLC